MQYTEQLEAWIHETAFYYLNKIHSHSEQCRICGCNLEIVVDQDKMDLLYDEWKEWAEEASLVPYNPIPYDYDDVEDAFKIVFGSMWVRVDGGKKLGIMWLNLKFFDNLADLQRTIVHELIHFETNIVHGPLFEALVDMYQLPTILNYG